MAKFRKKPVVIEAVQWTGTPESEVEMRAFLKGIGAAFLRPLNGEPSVAVLIEIPTLEGKMHASPGDWIIRGVKGEIYPCKDDIFQATYEPVGDDA